jgi:hypothetical protein
MCIADPASRPGIKLVCPPAIVAMRAALAATPPVRALRPQPVEQKLVAVAAGAYSLVHFSAQREPFLTQAHPLNALSYPLTPPKRPLHTL